MILKQTTISKFLPISKALSSGSLTEPHSQDVPVQQEKHLTAGAASSRTTFIFPTISTTITTGGRGIHLAFEIKLAPHLGDGSKRSVTSTFSSPPSSWNSMSLSQGEPEAVLKSVRRGSC